MYSQTVEVSIPDLFFEYRDREDNVRMCLNYHNVVENNRNIKILLTETGLNAGLPWVTDRSSLKRLMMQKVCNFIGLCTSTKTKQGSKNSPLWSACRVKYGICTSSRLNPLNWWSLPLKITLRNAAMTLSRRLKVIVLVHKEVRWGSLEIRGGGWEGAWQPGLFTASCCMKDPANQ